MKIWLDLRFLWDDFYSKFVLQLTKELINKSIDNTFIIYTNTFLDWFDYQNTTIKNVCIQNFSIKEQTCYLKILKKDNNNLMLFFNHYKPLFYKGSYFTLLFSLKDVYYSNFISYFEKYSFLYLLEKNLQKSDKVICFDSNTTNELIEKFNISENKIEIIPWFFPHSEKVENFSEIKIDILTKYSIVNKFFIYPGWNWVEKNYEKLIYVFERLKKNWLKVDLVILWENISKNIPLRNLIIKLNMQNNIHFMWIIKESEKFLLYKQSLWTIFPSFYEPFPFRLTEAVYLNSPILTSDLKNIKNIFKNSVNYFSPISINSIYENTLKFINNNKNKIDYSEVKNKYTKENTIKKLINIIK